MPNNYSVSFFFELYEKTLEMKTKELNKEKEELQMAESISLTLLKRIQELEMDNGE